MFFETYEILEFNPVSNQSHPIEADHQSEASLARVGRPNREA